MTGREVTVEVGSDRVAGTLNRSADHDRLFVMAHGAGAGMRHPFLEKMAVRLGERGIGTLRFQFPYMHANRRRPDPAGRLQDAVAAAVESARDWGGGARLFAGGKSMGGRMTSLAAASDRLPEVDGLIFLGFPLHPAGRPGVERAEHLSRVRAPMLFLQGTRDRLAHLDLLRPVLEKLGTSARLEIIEEADHSFAVPKRSGRTHDEVLTRLAESIDRWTRERIEG